MLASVSVAIRPNEICSRAASTSDECTTDRGKYGRNATLLKVSHLQRTAWHMEHSEAKLIHTPYELSPATRAEKCIPA